MPGEVGGALVAGVVHQEHDLPAALAQGRPEMTDEGAQPDSQQNLKIQVTIEGSASNRRLGHSRGNQAKLLVTPGAV